MANILISNLSEAVQEALQEYAGEVTEDIKEITHDVSKKFKDNTKKDAPRGARKKYYKYIDVRTTRETATGVTDEWYVKDPEYRLTHLIKNGHQTRSGGRTKSNDFIDRNYNIAEKEYVEKIEEVVRK